MKQKEKDLAAEINILLSGQKLAVLSTQRGGQPYSSLMAFAHTEDLKTLVVATGSSTRKNDNLRQDARVSLLVDSRSNREEDLHLAVALTVIGKASLAEGEERMMYQNLYCTKHPYLESFIHQPTTNLIAIQVRHYLLVKRFQHVMELHLTDEQDIFAG